MMAEIWAAIIAGVGGLVVYGSIAGLALIGLVRIADLLIDFAMWLWERWLAA